MPVSYKSAQAWHRVVYHTRGHKHSLGKNARRTAGFPKARSGRADRGLLAFDL